MLLLRLKCTSLSVSCPSNPPSELHQHNQGLQQRFQGLTRSSDDLHSSSRLSSPAVCSGERGGEADWCGCNEASQLVLSPVGRCQRSVHLECACNPSISLPASPRWSEIRPLPAGSASFASASLFDSDTTDLHQGAASYDHSQATLSPC